MDISKTPTLRLKALHKRYNTHNVHRSREPYRLKTATKQQQQQKETTTKANTEYTH